MNFTINQWHFSISPNILKYFSGTAIFTLLNTPLSASVSGLKKLDLYLEDGELSAETLSGFPMFVKSDSSLSNCHKFPKVSQ